MESKSSYSIQRVVPVTKYRPIPFTPEIRKTVGLIKSRLDLSSLGDSVEIVREWEGFFKNLSITDFGLFSIDCATR
jgi:hypothetical protein